MPVAVDLWLTSTEAWLHRQDALIVTLSQSERERRDRLLDPRIGLRFALGRGLLRAVLASRLGIDPAAVQFEIGTLGKPRLASSAGGRELRFNVSASQDCLAIALSTDCEVGVDVECHRTVSAEILRSRSVLSNGEREHLAGLPAEERAATFLRWWTRKEAIAKADGRGVGIGLHHIDVGPPAYEAKTRAVHVGGRSFLVCDSERIEGATCAVAAATSPHQIPTAFVRHVDYAPAIERVLSHGY